MNQIILGMAQYWGILIVLIVGMLYVLTHRVAAFNYAKKKAVSLMLAAEKRAEELVLSTGQDKFNWVVDKGYDLLPAPVRIVVSKPLFKMIVQELFDSAVAIAKAHQIQAKEPPIQNSAPPPISASTGQAPNVPNVNIVS